MSYAQQTDGTITLKNGQIREAVLYTNHDGSMEVMYFSNGLNRRMVATSSAEQAASFMSNAEREARRAEDEAFEAEQAESDRWAAAYGLDG